MDKWFLCLSVLTEFEKLEKKKLEDEMSTYAQNLEEETKKEKDKHERNIQALNKRKEELIKENKNKLKVRYWNIVIPSPSP